MEIVDATNPYQAAVLASARHGDGVEVADVRPAVGRAPATTTKIAKPSAKTTKKVVKKRRTLSAEARARLAQNLVKARDARARNLKAAKASTRKTKKRSVKTATKKTPGKSR